MAVQTEYHYREHRIKKYGTRKIFYKIFRPGGGSLNYEKYDTLKAAKAEIDRVLVRKQKYG